MSMRKQHCGVRLLGMLSLGALFLLMGCSLLDYPPLLEGCTALNNPPYAPGVPQGSASGDIDVPYVFSTTAVDPDGDNVSIKFDWGDGGDSGWSGYVASGDTISASHSYSAAGTFQVRAKTKDDTGMESGWSDTHAIEIGGSGGALTATIKWQWETDSDVGISSTPAIGPDGNIYVTAAVGGMSYLWIAERLFCISPQGSMLWKSQELDDFGAGDPVIGSDGTIYVVGYYTLYAFNPNGTLKWEWTTPEDGDPYPHAQICGPTLGPDGTIYTSHCGSGAYHRYLFAHNPDGSMKWARDLFDPDIGNGISRLTVGRDGVLYGQGTHWVNNCIYAFNPDNGALLWQSVGLETSIGGGFAIGSDGTIYIPGSLQGLIAMNSDGTIRWEWKEATTHWYSIPSIGSDGTIYGTSNGLHALTSSGQLKWTTDAEAPNAPEMAIAADGTMYSTLYHSEIGLRFTAVNPDGSTKWMLEIPSGGGSPAIGSDGTIYVTGGLRPGVLTAVYGSSPLASSPWPRSRHDNRNTGAYGGY